MESFYFLKISVSATRHHLYELCIDVCVNTQQKRINLRRMKTIFKHIRKKQIAQYYPLHHRK